MARLGIHTEVSDPSQPDKTHAWISLQKDGVTKTYSLYDDENDRSAMNGQSHGWNGSGTHVRENVDDDIISTASRFKDLSGEEQSKFRQFLNKPQKFETFHNNCSSFAADAWQAATSEKLDNHHLITGREGKTHSYETPVGLEQSIRERNLERAPEQEKEPPPNQPADVGQSSPRKSLADYQRWNTQPEQQKTDAPRSGQDQGRKSLSDYQRFTPDKDRSDR